MMTCRSRLRGFRDSVESHRGDGSCSDRTLLIGKQSTIDRPRMAPCMSRRGAYVRSRRAKSTGVLEMREIAGSTNAFGTYRHAKKGGGSKTRSMSHDGGESPALCRLVWSCRFLLGRSCISRKWSPKAQQSNIPALLACRLAGETLTGVAPPLHCAGIPSRLQKSSGVSTGKETRQLKGAETREDMAGINFSANEVSELQELIKIHDPSPAVSHGVCTGLDPYRNRSRMHGNHRTTATANCWRPSVPAA